MGLDFFQWQPLLCRPTASLFAAPGAEWLILGRKAEGLRSSVCQWCAEPSVWWVGVRWRGSWAAQCVQQLAAAGCGGGGTRRVGVRGGRAGVSEAW